MWGVEMPDSHTRATQPRATAMCRGRSPAALPRRCRFDVQGTGRHRDHSDRGNQPPGEIPMLAFSHPRRIDPPGNAVPMRARHPLYGPLAAAASYSRRFCFH